MTDSWAWAQSGVPHKDDLLGIIGLSRVSFRGKRGPSGGNQPARGGFGGAATAVTDKGSEQRGPLRIPRDLAEGWALVMAVLRRATGFTAPARCSSRVSSPVAFLALKTTSCIRAVASFRPLRLSHHLRWSGFCLLWQTFASTE